MKTAPAPTRSRLAPARALAKLRTRLAKAEAALLTSSALERNLVTLRNRLVEVETTLRAIRTGEVDAVVVAGKKGPQIFTLQGAERAYRVLIESMNEGALTLTTDKTILYANHCFARMVKCPLEKLAGGSFRRFLSAKDRVRLRPLMKRTRQGGAKISVWLKAGDGSRLPAQISIRPLARNGFARATIGMVVTDMSEARRTEELLRALTQRVVQVQEIEREHVALELHDNITQLLCAVLFRSQALADKLSARDRPAKQEAIKLRQMLGRTAEAVVRISRELRPSSLEHLGLVAVLRDANTEFADRTGVTVRLIGATLAARLPANAELALYRIFQEILKNVEKHAQARHVTVSLRRLGQFVELAIRDDGVGIKAARLAAPGKSAAGLGLLGMRERAANLGGTLTVSSGRRAGTGITVRLPLPPTATPAAA